MRIDRRILDMDAPADGWTSLQGAMGAAGHQLGGTRMGASAATGVVDADCRVWGTNNLFVAGSSVFRTSGHATPTLTIVQLALRLADRLDRLLGAG
jgi:choline dehydrogenase-like flavoprotein